MNNGLGKGIDTNKHKQNKRDIQYYTGEVRIELVYQLASVGLSELKINLRCRYGSPCCTIKDVLDFRFST